MNLIRSIIGNLHLRVLALIRTSEGCQVFQDMQQRRWQKRIQKESNCFLIGLVTELSNCVLLYLHGRYVRTQEFSSQESNRVSSEKRSIGVLSIGSYTFNQKHLSTEKLER